MMASKDNNYPGYSGNPGNSGTSGTSGPSGFSGYSGQYRCYSDGTASALRKPVVYTSLRFYQRSDVLYQLTQVFCQRYLPKHGDRTVDQMVQAARSTKQNIAEGSSDGQTSMEIELKLLGVARGSNKELANMAICLCHQVDSGLTKYLERKDREFTTEGGIRERMTAARLGQRESQRQTIDRQAPR